MEEAQVVANELGLHGAALTLLRRKDDAETWRCGRLILKRFLTAAAGLSIAQRARKAELAASELRAAGLPTPAVLVTAPGALLFEEAAAVPWSAAAYASAARALRRLHEVDGLSGELGALMAATDENRGRIAAGVGDPVLAAEEPRVAPEELRPVHGDYFRANLVPVAGGVAIIDWDLLGFGDPAWDLGFLVAAERGHTHSEVLDAYGPIDAATRARVDWHVACWRRFWAKEALTQ
jgi:aminoglycoside phosphotransferase (APT) family kinase protein